MSPAAALARLFLRGGLVTAALLVGLGAKIATVAPLTEDGALAWARVMAFTEAIAADIDMRDLDAAGAGGGSDNQGRAVRQAYLDIAAEREILADQRAALASERDALAALRALLDEDRDRLAALHDRIEAALARQAKHRARDVAHLVDLYAGMKPKEAAAILTEMDLQIAITVLVEMETRTAAPILAKMPPTRAQTVSQVLLERAKLPADRQAIEAGTRG